jgi:hypothetical protein
MSPGWGASGALGLTAFDDVDDVDDRLPPEDELPQPLALSARVATVAATAREDRLMATTLRRAG